MCCNAGRHDPALLAELGQDDAAVVVDRFLYRGVPEPFEPVLRANRFDRCLWLAEEPTVAQTYIPSSGGSVLLAVAAFELDERVRPSFSGTLDGQPCPSGLYAAALEFGFPAAEDVLLEEWGGRARSYRIPAGYPTRRQVVERLAAMGYAWDGGAFSAWVRTGPGGRLLPKDWRAPGNLLILDGWRDLRLYDWVSGREGDLTDCDFHHSDLFRRLEGEGFEGIRLHDFCQTETHGNVGHRSVGVFAAGLARLRWAALPAVHWEWPATTALWPRTTPEFEAACLFARTR